MKKRYGTVKWFNDKRGYGFIIPSDGSTDIFVHHTSIHMDGYRSLREGERVEFEVNASPRGPQAANVVVMGGI